jgi:hypothetical protein
MSQIWDPLYSHFEDPHHFGIPTSQSLWGSPSLCLGSSLKRSHSAAATLQCSTISSPVFRNVAALRDGLPAPILRQQLKPKAACDGRLRRPLATAACDGRLRRPLATAASDGRLRRPLATAACDPDRLHDRLRPWPLATGACDPGRLRYRALAISGACDGPLRRQLGQTAALELEP